MRSCKTDFKASATTKLDKLTPKSLKGTDEDNKEQIDEQLPGQLTIDDWLGGK